MAQSTPIANTLTKGVAIALAAIILLFIASQLYNPQPQAQPTPIPTAQATPTPAPLFVEVSGIEAAQSAIAFINGMKLADGTYVYSVDCDSTGCNKKSNLTGLPQSNAWAAFANIGLYRATKDSKYLDAAKAEVAKEIEICSKADGTIVGPSEQKNCLWALVQPYEVYKETNDAKTKDFILKNAETILRYLRPDPTQGAGMLQSIIARELAIAYSLSSDGKFLQAAVGFDNAAKQSMDADNRVAFANGFPVRLEECWQKLAELQLYGAAQNQSYLDSAKGFFDGIEQAGASGEFYKNFEIATQLHPCIESLQLLSEKTGASKYSEEAAKISAYLAQASWDSEFSKKYDGRGGFATMFCRVADGSSLCAPSNDKTITDNSYGAYLLAKPGLNLPIERTAGRPKGQLYFNSTQLPKITPQPVPAKNWTHFDPLETLQVFKASDSPSTFYASYFVDINAPLANAVISVDGEKFPFDSAPSCFNMSVLKGACTRRDTIRSEIQYVATFEKAVAGKTYSIGLSSGEKTAKIQYVHS